VGADEVPEIAFCRQTASDLRQEQSAVERGPLHLTFEVPRNHCYIRVKVLDHHHSPREEVQQEQVMSEMENGECVAMRTRAGKKRKSGELCPQRTISC